MYTGLFQETKTNSSISNSNGFGESIFVDEECKSPADQPVPMFLEQTEAVPDQSDHMVSLFLWRSNFVQLYFVHRKTLKLLI